MAIEKKKQETETAQTGPQGKPIKVQSYAGYKGDEKPRSFELDGRRLTVLAVKRMWREEPAQGKRQKTVFRVQAHDGRTYDIAVDSSGQWTLEPRSPGRSHG